MLLLYADEVDPSTQAQRDAELPVWQELTQSLREAGLLVSNSPLLGVDTATTVRVRDGATRSPTGPGRPRILVSTADRARRGQAPRLPARSAGTLLPWNKSAIPRRTRAIGQPAMSR